MKKNILIFLIIFSKFCIAQNLQFQPLETNVNQEDRLLVPPTFDANFKNLYYVTYRYNSPFDFLLNPQQLIINDSILFDVTKLNLYSGIKNIYRQKKINLDSNIICYNPFNIEIDSISKSIKILTATFNDSLLLISNLSVYNNRNVYLFDSTINLIKKQRLENFSSLPDIASNKSVYINDSFLVCMNYNITGTNTYPDKMGVIKYNINTGKVVDSFINTSNPQLILLQIDKLNDSTIIVLSDSFFFFLDNNLNLKYKSSVFSGSFPLNGVPGKFRMNRFFIEDTTYYYLTKQIYPSVNPDRNQFESVKGSDGSRNVLLKINHDSAFNAMTNYAINISIKNTDFITFDNKFCVSDLGYTQDSITAIAVMNFDSTNQLRWKKYIGFDANYNDAMILATPDSGCMVLVNRKDIINQQEKYDLYYIKLDKNGNQQYDYLPLSLPNYLNPTAINIEVFPNPFTNSLFIKSEKIEEYNLVLYNESGQKIVQKNISSNQTISLENLVTGVYFYTLSSKNKLVKSGILEKK